jgi:hypothetical protein
MSIIGSIMQVLQLYLDEHFFTPLHRCRNHVVAGVLIMKVNVLLEKAIEDRPRNNNVDSNITSSIQVLPDSSTGTGISLSKSLVCSLNCLQNSAIFKPSGPSA